MLKSDIQLRKKKEEDKQRTLDKDLVEQKVKERIIPYSDPRFRRIAIEWLIATDQVCFLYHISIQITYEGLS